MRIRTWLLIGALMLQGCGVPLSPSAIADTPEARYLRDTVDRLAAHDYAALEARLDDRVHQPDTRRAFERLASLLPPDAPIAVQPVNWSFVKGAWQGDARARIAVIGLEYDYPSSRWILASATLSGEPGDFRIVGFNLEPLPKPLSETNALTLRNKESIHYLFLLLALASLAISLYAFVRCLRTKGLRRKWLWAVFTLVGAAMLSLNWTTGEPSVQLLRVCIPPATVFRFGVFGPWFLLVSIPVGAVVFLWKHRKVEPASGAPAANVDA